MCASSSTRPAVSTATSTFPPPLKNGSYWGSLFRQQMLEYVWRRTSQNNVNPQFDQRGQVKHHCKTCKQDWDLPESGENVRHQLLISQSPSLLCVSRVEGVRDEQAAINSNFNVFSVYIIIPSQILHGKEMCLTWFIPTVTAQGLRRAKEYARLGFNLRHCSWKSTTWRWLPATWGNLNDAPPKCRI